MVELDGVTYTVKTPSENTQDMLDRINTYCTNNNVTNSKNELIQLEAKFSSPIYLVLWALGYLVTVLQNLVVSVGRTLSVQESNEQQLLNIADIAGIKRAQASATTFDIQVKAMSTDDSNWQADVNEGKLVITSDDTITYQGIVYAPALHPDITIEPNQYGYITMVAQSSGSQDIAAGTITEFDSTIPNLASLQQFVAIPGQDIESLASLRQRLQRRQYSGTSIDAAIDEMRALPGVTVANIIYNTSVSETKYIGADSIELPPRWSIVIVQGYNANIATAYWNHLSAPNIAYDEENDSYDYRNIPANRILEVQSYVTHAQQKLPIVILKPSLKQLYVQVYIGMPVVAEIIGNMKNAITAYINRNLVIGQSVSSSMILTALADYASYTILGATVGSSSGGTSYKTTQAEDVLWTLSTENININMPEA